MWSKSAYPNAVTSIVFTPVDQYVIYGGAIPNENIKKYSYFVEFYVFFVIFEEAIIKKNKNMKVIYGR